MLHQELVVIYHGLRLAWEHSALKHLLSKQDFKPRLIRWTLLLQEFDLEIKDKKGKDNGIANHLSRVEGGDSRLIPMFEEFPDEKLFSLNSSLLGTQILLIIKLLVCFHLILLDNKRKSFCMMLIFICGRNLLCIRGVLIE